jgi:hypothetical protein
VLKFPKNSYLGIVAESLLAMLRVCGEDEDEEAEKKRLQETEAAKLKAEQREVIRKKILAASKMLSMMKTLRYHVDTSDPVMLTLSQNGARNDSTT